MIKAFVAAALSSYAIAQDSIDVAGKVSSSSALQYDLEIYTDAAYTTPYDGSSNGPFVVGNPLYFKVDAQYPIAGLEFSLLNCQVKSGNDANLEYAIISNMCADAAVNTQVHDPAYDTASIRAQYDVFEFIADAQQQDTNTVHITCEVVLCNGSDDSSTCRSGCQGARKRRSIDAKDIVTLKSAEFNLSK